MIFYKFLHGELDSCFLVSKLRQDISLCSLEPGYVSSSDV